MMPSEPAAALGNPCPPVAVADKVATLNAFKAPQQIIAFYHQRRDRPEVLTPEPLLHALKIAFEWVRGGGE